MPAACATSVSVTYTLTDECNRTATCTQTIQIVNVAPTMTCPTGPTVECISDIQAAVTQQVALHSKPKGVTVMHLTFTP